jgi:hypothetical protein
MVHKAGSIGASVLMGLEPKNRVKKGEIQVFFWFGNIQ